jgi:UDPglucose 6-dehydrogenase
VEADKNARLNGDQVSIHEPGLEPVIARNAKAGRLQFRTDAEAGVRHGLFQLIAVGTPPDEDRSADLLYVLEVARTIGTHMADDRIVINKSTVPVGTADKVSAKIAEALAARGSSAEIDNASRRQ